MTIYQPTLMVMNEWSVDYYIGYFGGVQKMNQAPVLFIFTGKSLNYYLNKLTS